MSDTSEQVASCGQGLAASAPLPAEVGELLAALGQVLAHHQEALDLGDDAAREEHEAYQQLATELGGAASQVRAVATQMTAYRHLPMGRHDEAKMAAPEGHAAFARFVAAERRLVELLTRRLREDEEMLAGWG